MKITSAGNERSSVAKRKRGDVVERAKEAQVKASADLIVGLREMVNNPAYSDVVFLCNDGKPVRALRMFLASRSEVLRSMLANGMAESNRDEITLAGVSSPVMLSVLEFLYTGTLSSHHPQSWKLRWEVLIASQFFLLPKLGDLVRELLFESICNVADDLEAAAILLTEAMGFKDLCCESDDIFGELVGVLSSSDWSDSCFVKNLTEDAFHYLLAKSRTDPEFHLEGLDIHSFREYFRFRAVIQWRVYQSPVEPSVGEKFMARFVADRSSLLLKCELRDLSMLNEYGVCWDNLQPDKVPKVAAKRLLYSIDYHLIHPVLLAKLVEPLELLPVKLISKVYRFHALQSTSAIKVPKC